MNLSNFSLLVASRALCAVGLCAAVLVGCGDDDDDANAADAGRADAGKDTGPTGTAGKNAAGGAGGTKASAGSGGKAAGPVKPVPVEEEDAGLAELDGGSEPVADPTAEPVVDANPSGFRDVSIQMNGFADEVGKYMQVQLVAANGELLTSAVLNGLPAATYNFALPDTIPPGQEVELRVWSDTSGMVENVYEAGMDHAWTKTIAAAAATVPALVTLAHGTQTPPPTVGSGEPAGSLAFMLMGTSDYYGNLFELRVYEDVSGRLVARTSMPVPGIEVAFDVDGVLKPGTTYRVDFAIDVNDSMAFDNPPADASWRRIVTAEATGNNGGPGAALWFWGLPPTTEYVDVGF